MEKRITARIIGEESAGLTAVEILEDGEVVWSQMWFENGASGDYYVRGIREACQTAMDCADYEIWAEWEYDEDGNKIINTYEDGYCTVAEYIPGEGWISDGPCGGGQSADFIAFNRDKLPTELVTKWEEEYDLTVSERDQQILSRLVK